MEDYDAVDPAESPEALLSRGQLMTATRDVLGTLSTSDQQTLVATFNNEYPLSIPGATFRKRRERARVRLREAWRNVYGS